MKNKIIRIRIYWNDGSWTDHNSETLMKVLNDFRKFDGGKEEQEYLEEEKIDSIMRNKK